MIFVEKAVAVSRFFFFWEEGGSFGCEFAGGARGGDGDYVDSIETEFSMNFIVNGWARIASFGMGTRCRNIT